jgi:hypothetical protein
MADANELRGMLQEALRMAKMNGDTPDTDMRVCAMSTAATLIEILGQLEHLNNRLDNGLVVQSR